MRIPFTRTEVFLMPRSDPQKELEKWRESVELAPEDADARLRYASWLHTAGRREEAIREYREAIRLYNLQEDALRDCIKVQMPALAHEFLGELLREAGRRTEARQHWERVVVLYAGVISNRRELDKNRQVRRARKQLHRYPAE